MNPILHELEKKQWIWTAANTTKSAVTARRTTGYTELDSALSGGFPDAGMIHINSQLGCGELRLMLDVLKQQHNSKSDKLWVFIAPPFQLNAEFLLNEGLSLANLVLLNPSSDEEALWSAEQCAKSGACHAVFLWQQRLSHTHIKKVELAALHGDTYCFWFDHNDQHLSNMPLSLSLSLSRENEQLKVKINKQKTGWAQPQLKIKLPFKCRTGKAFRHQAPTANNVVNLHAKQ